MNKYGIVILKDLSFDFIDLLKDLISTDLQTFHAYNINRLFISKYGDRKITSYLDQFIDEYGEYTYDNKITINSSGGSAMYYLFYNVYGDKWKKLSKLYSTEFDALKPFNMTLTETSTDTLSVTKDSSVSEDSSSMYAFNSEEPVPVDKSSSSNSNEYSRENPTSRNYTRVGNIGNMSLQDLFEKELHRLDHLFYDIIFKDIATIICRGKYI